MQGPQSEDSERNQKLWRFIIGAGVMIIVLRAMTVDQADKAHPDDDVQPEEE